MRAAIVERFDAIGCVAAMVFIATAIFFLFRFGAVDGATPPPRGLELGGKSSVVEPLQPPRRPKRPTALPTLP